jgi:hypothetical protein
MCRIIHSTALNAIDPSITPARRDGPMARIAIEMPERLRKIIVTEVSMKICS